MLHRMSTRMAVNMEKLLSFKLKKLYKNFNIVSGGYIIIKYCILLY